MDVDSDGHIREFREKNDDDGKIVNGGFMVLSNRSVFDYIEGDDTVFESAVGAACQDGQLMR